MRESVRRATGAVAVRDGGPPRPADGLSPARWHALDLVASVVPSHQGDAAFDEVTADWDGRGCTGPFLAHWLLYRLGCADPGLVNRTAPDSGLSYAAGRDIAKLYHGGTAPFVKWVSGASPLPGDIVFLRGDGTPTEHVFVFLADEFTADGPVWHTAEAGQVDGRGRQCARYRRRRRIAGFGALRVSGDTPACRVVGWIDLDLVDRDLLGR